MNISCYNKGWIRASLPFSGKTAAMLLVLWVLSTEALAQVSGHVYRDFNGDGVRQVSAPAEPGLGGVTVSAYTAGNSTPLTTTTDSLGSYSFSLPSGQAVRLEFSGLPFESYAGIAGANNGSLVQFVTAPASGADLAVSDPRLYCDTPVPQLVAPTYVLGDALATGSNSASLHTLIRFPYGATGQVDVSSPLTDAAAVGTVWGGLTTDRPKNCFTPLS